jgi:hypothetical protein
MSMEREPASAMGENLNFVLFAEVEKNTSLVAVKTCIHLYEGGLKRIWH